MISDLVVNFAKNGKLFLYSNFKILVGNLSLSFQIFRFVTKDKLIRHTRIHTGEKPFKCTYCEKAYNQSNELKKHLHSHLGENVYQCDFCPLRFPNVKIVREHFLTHKNDDEETRARNLSELNAAEVKGIYIR